MADDPTLDALVDDTLKGAENLLPADALKDMRFLLAATLASHPVISKLVDELHPSAPRAEVGIRNNADADEDTRSGGDP